MATRWSAASRASARSSPYWPRPLPRPNRAWQLSPIMIRAVIFDLDGTLVDTEPLHFAAFNEVLRPDGIEIPLEEYSSRLIGFNDHDCFATVLRENRKEASEQKIADLIARKSAIYQAMVAQPYILSSGPW